MIQFLSIIFFLGFLHLFWVFQKFPFFCVILYIRSYPTQIQALIHLQPEDEKCPYDRDPHNRTEFVAAHSDKRQSLAESF